MPSLRTLLYGSAPYRLRLIGRVPRDLAVRLPAPWPGDRRRGAELAGGVFRFAGQTVQHNLPPWGAEQQPAAFLSELHGFRWLADLAALGAEGGEPARRWTADWIARYDIFEPLAWRGDVMGDRLFAWIEHFDMIAGPESDPDGELRRRALLASLAMQARHLARIAAQDGQGIDRLKALRGAVAVAAALRSRGRLLRALRQLERETEVQILRDGGHFGRGPGMQLEALRCLVDARAALLAANAEVPPFLQQAIDRAAPMLRFFRHPEGRLALFHGSEEAAADVIELVLARSEAKGRAPASARYLNFERMQAGGAVVIMDCGRPPVAASGAAGHAGTLAFEMSYGRQRIIVNCGAYRGPSSNWQLAMRASAAHSTLVVADTNSTEIRADGSLGAGPEAVSCDRVEDEGSHLVTASHDGYRRNFGLIHERRLFLAAHGEDLRGEDRLTGEAGRKFVIRFHLHPTVEATLAAEAGVLLATPGGGVWRLRAEGAVLSLAESVYLGEGSAQKAQQIVLDGHVGSTDALVRWALKRETRLSAEGSAA